MKLEHQIADIAEAHHATALRWAPKNDGHFKSLVTVLIDDKVLPLLLVGNVHSTCEDGDCIAVLNPTKELAAALMPGVAYAPADLKKIAAGSCDCMVALFLDHYKKKKQTVLGKYVAKTPRPVEISAQTYGQ
jgi:hypothetical protein